MPYIQEHVRALNEWIDRVEQVVVVDSESTDGTLEYIRAHLRHPNVTYLNHPPGLYQSWNAAIRAVDAKYTYMATVNDRMPFETLARLYEEAERYKADVVVSAPELTSEADKVLDQDWPIHEFIDQYVTTSVYELSAIERLVFSCLHLPGTLIGSSASNLYRTESLQSEPFSAEYGHAGDSAWALARPFKERWLICREGRSCFWIHGQSNSTSTSTAGRASRSKLYRLASEQLMLLRDQVAGSDTEILDLCLSQLVVIWREKEAVMVDYQKLKASWLPWYLIPRGWTLRRKKNQIRACLESVETQVGQALSARNSSDSTLK